MGDINMWESGPKKCANPGAQWANRPDQPVSCSHLTVTSYEDRTCVSHEASLTAGRVHIHRTQRPSDIHSTLHTPEAGLQHVAGRPVSGIISMPVWLTNIENRSKRHHVANLNCTVPATGPVALCGRSSENVWEVIIVSLAHQRRCSRRKMRWTAKEWVSSLSRALLAIILPGNCC